MLDPTNESAQRTYWRNQAEQAFHFMTKMRTYPLNECNEPMAPLIEAANGTEIHFSTTLLANKLPRIFALRTGLIQNFRDVARLLNNQGWILKVMDAYRSPHMQRQLSHSPIIFDRILKQVLWEQNGQTPTPEFLFRRLSIMIATRSRVGTHVAGSAIDIAILDRTTGYEIDRGGQNGECSPRTPMASPFLTPHQRINRDQIEKIFRTAGWHPYPWEFWHFNAGDCFAEYLANSGKPGRYGPIHYDGSTITPIPADEADTPLEPLAFYQQQITESLARIHSANVLTSTDAS